jgi:hypothetical protein
VKAATIVIRTLVDYSIWLKDHHTGARIIDALFFILGWDRYGFDKMCARTCYTELVFLYSVGSAAHVVHSVASGT